MGPNNRGIVVSTVRITQKNCERLAELTAEETSMPIVMMRTFFQLMIGEEFTDEELTDRINEFIDSLIDRLEMSIDDNGEIFYYRKDNPDDVFYSN